MSTKKVSVLTLAMFTLVALGSGGAALAGQKKREKRAQQWPMVDLTPYSILYIEDFKITDPKASKRKKAMMIKSAPARIASYVAATVEAGLFEEIKREPAKPTSGSVVLRVEITQYKPGSSFGRAMLAGVGSAHLDFKAALVEAESGNQLTSFSGDRTWAWGGAYGMSKGIEDMEQNLALELTLYLQRCKGGTREPEEDRIAGSD